jgi:hypothetical protein
MSTDREPLVEALDGLTVFLEDTNYQIGRLLDDHLPDAWPDPEKTVPVLSRLRTLRRRLGQLEASVERVVAGALGTGMTIAAGVPLEVHGGLVRREWQHREVARLLAENALVDEDTGEVDPEQMRVAMRAVYAVIEAGRMDWRIRALAAAGLSEDGLCKREPARRTVQFLTPGEVHSR